MTAKEYSKKYDLAINFKMVSEESFEEGRKQGIFESQTTLTKTLQNKLDHANHELKELRLYKKDMEETLYNPERLADLIGGL
jgi:hypothetical protein